jgi:hypothetical protein
MAQRSGQLAGLQLLLIFSLATFLLHLAWELLQMPLYESMRGLDRWQATFICLKATVGDVWIALASFAVGAWYGQGWNWFVRPTPASMAVYERASNAR